MLAITGIASFLGLRPAQASRMPEHFAGDRFETIMARLFDKQKMIDSDEIALGLPEIAENGAVVPITISGELDDIDRIYLLVEKNPTPLAAEFELSSTAMFYVTTRFKMAESCHVIVIARRGDQLLKTQKWVNIGQGGCGTG